MTSRLSHKLKTAFFVFAAATLFMQTPVSADFISSDAEEKSCFVFEQGTPYLAVRRLQQFWSLLPQKMREYFEENLGVVIYVQKEIGDAGGNESTEDGSFVIAYTEGRVISGRISYRIYFDSDFGTGHADVILHEAGHLLYHSAGGLTAPEEEKLSLLYKEEAYAVAAINPDTAAHTVSSEDEFFAESFMLYFTKPEKLKGASEDMYELVSGIVKRFL